MKITSSYSKGNLSIALHYIEEEFILKKSEFNSRLIANFLLFIVSLYSSCFAPKISRLNYPKLVLASLLKRLVLNITKKDQVDGEIRKDANEITYKHGDGCCTNTRQWFAHNILKICLINFRCVPHYYFCRNYKRAKLVIEP